MLDSKYFQNFLLIFFSLFYGFLCFYPDFVQINFKKMAIRFSEYEPIEISKKFINKVDWIWIDTYTKLPVNFTNIKTIKKFKSCIVCPERWGREKDIKKYFYKMRKMNFLPDSVMTSKKNSLKWLKLSQKKTNN